MGVGACAFNIHPISFIHFGCGVSCVSFSQMGLQNSSKSWVVKLLLCSFVSVGFVYAVYV